MSSAAFQTWAADPGRREIVLASLSPYVIASEAETTLYASSDKTPPGQGIPAHEAQLLLPVTFSAETFVPGTVGEIADFPKGEIRLGSHFGNLDVYADPTLYAWDGRTAILRYGGYSPQLGRWLDYDEYEPRYYQMEAARLEGEDLVLSLRDQNSQFDDELQTRTFLDTGWMLKGGGTTSDFVGFGDIAKLRIVDALSFQARLIYKANGAYQQLFGWTGGSFRVGVDATDHLRLDWHKATVSTTKTMSAAMTDGHPYVIEGMLSDTELILKIIPERTRGATREVFTGSGWTGRDSGGDSFRFLKSFGASDPSPSMLDMVRIWSETKAEAYLINRRYRGLTTAEKAEAALELCCDLDDGTGSTVTDSSGSAANGTISGTCTWYPSLLGSAEAVGNVLPDLWGPNEGCEPILVYKPERIYMVASTSIQEITRTLEGGIPHERDTDYTDAFAFLAATTDPAEFDTLITPWGSYFRLGSDPERGIRFDGEGDNSGSGYVETAADVARRIMTTRGRVPISDPGGLDTASFTTLNTAAPAPIGLYVRDRMTRTEALGKVLSSVGAVTYPVRATGKQAVYQFRGVVGSSVLTLTEADIVDIKELQPARPSFRHAIGHRRCWAPMESGEIFPAATQAEAAFYAKELRWALSDGDNRTVHRLAEDVQTETLLVAWNDALEEANRRQELFGTPVKPLEVRVNTKGLELDRFQVVTLSLRDRDARNRWQSRYNLGAGSERIILGVAEAVRGTAEGEVEGTATLVLWGAG